jgi:hypothetical protein
MPSYQTPPFPLLANVWYNAQHFPLGIDPPDAQITCSLSPIPLKDFVWLPFQPSERTSPTHIIRTPSNPLLGENWAYQTGAPYWPATVFEVPPGSGHTYLAVFAHQVGTGFDNHFSRVYVTRIVGSATTDHPVFQGWI